MNEWCVSCFSFGKVKWSGDYRSRGESLARHAEFLWVFKLSYIGLVHWKLLKSRLFSLFSGLSCRILCVLISPVTWPPWKPNLNLPPVTLEHPCSWFCFFLSSYEMTRTYLPSCTPYVKRILRIRQIIHQPSMEKQWQSKLTHSLSILLNSFTAVLMIQIVFVGF